MNLRITLASIISIVVLSQLSNAAGPAVKNIFKAGDPASAAQVNANFQELADRIPITYDYHNYSVPTSVASKTFTNANISASTSSTYVETINRVAINASATKVTVHRAFPDGHAIEFDYLASPNSYDFIEERDYAATDLVNPASTFTLANPVPERTSSMHVGGVFGSGSTISTSGAVTTPGLIEVMNVLVGTEAVTLNVNGASTTYNDCIRIIATRFNSTGSYGGNVVQTNWYCNGMGLVKRMVFNTTTGATNLIVLTGTTP